jgi:hypothetical protein
MVNIYRMGGPLKLKLNGIILSDMLVRALAHVEA